MKKITPLLCFKASLLALSFSSSITSAKDIISKTLPKLSPSTLAPTEIQSTDGGFFNNDDLYIIQQINKERTNRGLNALRLFHYSGTNHAATWTVTNANLEQGNHSHDAAAGLPSGSKCRENIGRGGSAKGVMERYMLSRGHRGIILDPDYNAVVSASYRSRDQDGRLIFYNTVRILKLTNPSAYQFPPVPFTIAGNLCTVLGTIKNDVINTNNSNHVVISFGGNDRITGASIVAGGRGSDIITGTNGIDHLYGQGGHDTIYGRDGNDELYGGPGKDTIQGNAGNDKILGGYNDDVIHGGAGNDLIYGQKGSDKIYGQSGTDTIYPGPSGDNDTVIQ